MPMTKKERQEVEELRAELFLRQALRWTEPHKSDIPAPKGFDEEASGFVFNWHSLRVEPAWSSSVVHGRGYATSKEQRKNGSSGTQKGIPLYSNRMLALRAMRHAVERECASKLAEVDRQIEELKKFSA
jgi:hypothetical protein